MRGGDVKEECLFADWDWSLQKSVWSQKGRRCCEEISSGLCPKRCQEGGRGSRVREIRRWHLSCSREEMACGRMPDTDNFLARGVVSILPLETIDIHRI